MAQGVREARMRRTREVMTDAALRRFSEHGFDATSVDDIAADAEVSRQTFFRYFATKDAVVTGPYVATFERWEAAVAAARAGRTVIDVLRDASEQVMDAYDEDPAFWDRFQDVTTTDSALRTRMLELQATLQLRAASALAARLGLDPLDLRPRMAAAAAMAGVQTAAARWHMHGRSGDRRTAVRRAYDELESIGDFLMTAVPGDPPATAQCTA